MIATKRSWIILAALGVCLCFLRYKLGSGCNATFDKSSEEDKEKILSYRFPLEALKYLKNFKCLATLSDDTNGCYNDNDATVILPTIVTGASAGHFEESMSMLRILNNGLRKKYTGIKVVYFDLGLEDMQKQEIKELCGSNCDFRTFLFEKFPQHVKILKGYAWKPLLLQLVLDETKFAMWMDTSVDIQSMNVDELMLRAKSRGILFDQGSGTIAQRTSKFLFDFLGEQPCLFEQPEVPTTFVIAYWSQHMSKYIMEPWLSCALSINCMVPAQNDESYLACTKPYDMKYHQCHRFEQSTLGILMNRLFHGNLEENLIRNAGVEYSVKRHPR